MKKILNVFIITILICSCVACSSLDNLTVQTAQAANEQEYNRYILLTKENDKFYGAQVEVTQTSFITIVDLETGVQYLYINATTDGFRGYGNGAAITLLIDETGKPLLYNDVATLRKKYGYSTMRSIRDIEENMEVTE